MPDETQIIITELRVRGQRQYVLAMRGAATSVESLDRTTDNAARSIGRSTDRMGKKFDRLGRGIGRFAKGGAASVGLLAGAAGVAGLKYNELVENATMANSVLLGNEKAGKRLTKQLVKLDQAIPTLGLPDLLQGSRYLVNAGFSAKRTTKTMAKLGDAISVLGNQNGELDRITYALGQMGSGTNIQTDEFRQLADTGVTSFSRMGDQFGMTGGEFKKAMADGKISSEDFFKAFDKDLGRFEGGAEKAQGTFSGQVSTMGANWNRIMGDLTEPVFKGLEEKLFPKVESALDKIDKWQKSGSAGHAWDDFKRFWVSPDLPKALDTLGDSWHDFKEAIKPAIPEMGKGAGFINKLLKLLDVSLVYVISDALTGLTWGIHALGDAAGWLGKQSVGVEKMFDQLVAMKDQIESGIGSVIASSVELAKSSFNSFIDFFARRVNDLIGIMNVAIRAYNKIPLKGDISEIGKIKIGGDKPERPAMANLGGTGHLAEGGPALARRPYVVGERGPELFIPNVNGSVKPNLGGAIHITVQSVLDGRVIAKSTANYNFNEMMRK